MLLGSASLSMKTVIKNIDDYMLKPLGESYFQWNMQFNDDAPDIVGDLEIKLSWCFCCHAEIVRTQRLTALLQTVSNPSLAPFIKLPNLMRELAISQDIDPDSLVNDMNEAAIYAEMLKGLQNAQQGTEPRRWPRWSATNRHEGLEAYLKDLPPTDNSGVGDGTVGTGVMPAAGEDGFTGNPPQVEG